LDWAVSFDKETKVTNALLRWVGNPSLSIKANGGLTVSRKAWDADWKQGLNELWKLF